jgi:hypothetical protein
LYYFTKKDRFLPVETLSGQPIDSLAKKSFMISDFSLNIQDMASIYQVMKRSHSINIFADGINILKGKDHRIGHQLHFLSCDTDTRDEYIYDDNAAALQQVKWSRVFEPGAKSFYLRWQDAPLDTTIVERILLMFFSAQAFVTAGKRTNEKMRENYHRLAAQEEDQSIKSPIKYLANFMDTTDLTTREEDKRSFFEAISVDISKGASDIREELSDFIKAHYEDSPLVKIFTSFKPILVVIQEDKYYFYNKTGFLILTDEQLQADVLTIACLLFCEDDVEKYFHFLATAFQTCYAYYKITDAEMMWLIPRRKPLLHVIKASNRSLKQRSLGSPKKRTLKKPKTL